MAKRFVFVLFVTAFVSQFSQGQTSPTYNRDTLHTYVLTPAGVPMDYHAARAYAKSIGGHLVAINGVGEQLFINFAYQAAGAPKRWIGLTDEVTEGTFLWDSGEPLTFMNFGPGEPNNFGGIEDWCEVLAGGLWNDDASVPVAPAGPNQGIIELPFGDRVDFDVQTAGCAPAFPTPLGAAGDPEGVSWNGAGGAARPALVSTSVFHTQPVSGLQGMYMLANGPVTSPPAGGPFPRPADLDANEIRIPVPAGALGVSFYWEFLNGENTVSTSFNDGLSIAIVDAGGNLVQNLVYADTNPAIALFPLNICATGDTREVLPLGPQSFSSVIQQTTDPIFLSVVCWNAGDNTVPSSCEIDAVQFWGDAKFKLEIAAPIGAGSISLVNKNGNTGDTYWTAITGFPGAYPYGWFFGIDINPAQLIQQISAGPPFSGTLVAPGTSSFAIFAGVPPGLLVFGVSVRFSPAGLFLDASSPEFFITL
jgi:hypothetical protein